MFQQSARLELLWINYTDITHTSFYSLIDSLFYGGHVKGWVKPENVYTHADLLALTLLFNKIYMCAMTLYMYI